MAENKKSFILYCDLIHTVSKLPDDKAGELFKHILKYVNDEDPQTEDLLLQICFEPIKQQLKRDLKVWVDFREKQRLNGLKGGRKGVTSDIPKEILKVDIAVIPDVTPEVIYSEKDNPNNPSLVLDNPNKPDVNLESLNVTVTVTDNVTVNENTTSTTEEEKNKLIEEGKKIVLKNIKIATGSKILPDHIQELCENLTSMKFKYSDVTDEILELDIITFYDKENYLNRRKNTTKIDDVFYYTPNGSKYHSLLDLVFYLSKDKIAKNQIRATTKLPDKLIMDWIVAFAVHCFTEETTPNYNELKRHIKRCWTSKPGEDFMAKQAEKNRYQNRA